MESRRRKLTCFVLLLQLPLVISFFDGQLPNKTLIEEQLKGLKASLERKDVDPGEALFLTPLIEAGDYDKARNLSRVGPLNGTDILSYSGFLTVNPQYNSNLFFWFIPALNNPSTAPVVVWLQGGPGGSSLLGLFAENGPWKITSDYKLLEANYTWASVFSLLYFDSPVGTGYSFTESDAGYARNETDVARDLYEALKQFFSLFNEYSKLDFYVTGESYAGKYVPAIAHKIHLENPNAPIKINLKGVAIGNGLIDPETQYNYGDFVYNIGLIDDNQRELFYEQQNLTLESLREGDYMKALSHYSILVIGAFSVENSSYSYYGNFTGLQDIYNFLLSVEPPDVNYYAVYVNTNYVRNSIHVGNLTYNSGQVVQGYLLADIMHSTKPWVEELLDNGYKVLIYSGQVDVCIPYSLTVNLINHLNWTHTEDYKVAQRIIWRVRADDLQVAGYAKRNYNFQEVLVRNAGHMVPHDQPRAALDMISRFVFDKSFA